jgi:hypothetical protein
MGLEALPPLVEIFRFRACAASKPAHILANKPNLMLKKTMATSVC